jgi:hypothetical protein
MANTPNSVVVLDQFGNLPVGVGTEGVVNGSNARAGTVGEFMQATVTFEAPSAVSSSVVTNLVLLPLTPGDWDVSGVIGAAPTVSLGVFAGGISSVSETFDELATSRAQMDPAAVNIISVPLPIVRKNLTTAANIFLVVEIIFTGATTQPVFGTLSARRMR